MGVREEEGHYVPSGPVREKLVGDIQAVWHAIAASIREGESALGRELTAQEMEHIELRCGTDMDAVLASMHPDVAQSLVDEANEKADAASRPRPRVVRGRDGRRPRRKFGR